MKITVLGTGTSTGVPVPSCTCTVCSSKDPKNQRLRTSIYIELNSQDYLDRDSFNKSESETIARVLIDTAPDLRAQALRAKLSRIDAVLYTHTHADHVFGIDDLRGFNFVNQVVIPVYANAKSADYLESHFRYAFFDNPDYEGGSAPQLELRRFESNEVLNIAKVKIIPLPVKHGSMDVMGYRIGSFAYITDCSFIPQETRLKLDGVKILILDGLRIRPHKTHFTFLEAIKEIEQIQPDKTYLTHISHEVDHSAGNEYLKQHTKLDVSLAFDGLVIEI